METTNIYTLTDPITNEVRYVGKANKVNERYNAHLNKTRKHQTHKRNWINKLRKQGLKPIVEVIDVVPMSEWRFWERYWISQMRAWGFNLINITDGGDGTNHGNQTSFKKGHKPWNVGTGNKEICERCGIEFEARPSNYRKFCSQICKGQNASENPNSGVFKKGNISPNKGRKYRNNTANPVLQLDLSGKLIKEHYSCREAAEEMGCLQENIRRACVGKSKTAKGFKWQYKNGKKTTS